jgi:Peptidase family M23/LysM domain
LVRTLIVRQHIAATHRIVRKISAVPAICLGLGILAYGIAYGRAFSAQAASVSNTDRVAFVLGNYINLDTLAPAPAQNELISVALSGTNVGGQTQDPSSAVVIQYVVQPGDSLSSIAASHSLRQVSIVDKNPSLMASTVLHAGQLLVIPNQDLDPAEAAKVSAQWKSTSAVKAQKKTSAVSTKLTSDSVITPCDQSLIYPISFVYESQPFSAVHPGVDLVAAVGTPVYAVADGVISIAASGWNGGYGKFIMEDFCQGTQARFAHLSAFAQGITAGSTVTQGQLIGFSGNTGNSTGPHLHFEIHVNNSAVNPHKYLP